MPMIVGFFWLCIRSLLTLCASWMECLLQPASLTCGHLAFSEGTHTDGVKEDRDLLSEAWSAEVQHTSSLDGDGGRKAVEDGLYACCGARHHAAVDCVRRVDLYAAQIHERCGERDPRWVPSEFAARKGSFWFRSVLAGYLFAPLPSYLEHFRPLERRLTAGQGGVLGVHIRRGDACHMPQGIDHNQHCVHTERYLFCSLVGLFCLYCRTLLTLVHYLRCLQAIRNLVI